MLEFKKYIKNKKLTQNESATIMWLCRFIPIQDAFENLRTMDLFQSTNIQFDQTNLNIALQKIGRRLIIPSPNNDLLRKYIRLILKNNVKK